MRKRNIFTVHTIFQISQLAGIWDINHCVDFTLKILKNDINII